jgi:hypothetical protein
MRTQPPTIFISATTADLIKARQVVTKALLDLGCHPEVQEHFGTGEGNIAAKEASKIDDCDAVIHLVGKAYGAEPVNEGNGRSYTQLEYDTAVRLKKPLYLFLATDQFFADPNNLPPTGLPIESSERIQKQQEHYSRLRSGDDIWFEFSSLAELRDKIMQLREKDKKWGKILKTDRRHYLWIAAATFVLLAAIGAGLLFMHGSTEKARQSDKEEQRRVDDETRRLLAEESEKTRKLIAALDQSAKTPNEQPPNLKGEELYEWMLNNAAKAEGISPAEAKARLARFVARADTDTSVSARDRELANIARKFVVRGFSPAEFEKYVKSLAFSDWRPKFFVLHNTVVPTLAQKPDGFSESFLKSMVNFLTNERKWNGGPHLFVDRNRIWIFNTLTEPGIHASSWNKESIGVDMLGDYDIEQVDDNVRDNAASAIAVLCEALNIDGAEVRFHRDDPRTHQSCPGKNVSKEEFIERVTNALAARKK